jgi:hypothetical protein
MEANRGREKFKAKTMADNDHEIEKETRNTKAAIGTDDRNTVENNGETIAPPTSWDAQRDSCTRKGPT